MIRADLRLQSTFSGKKIPIPQLVDLCGSKGYGAIAITDQLWNAKTVSGKAARVLKRTLTHESLPIYQEILKSEARRAWSQYKMVLIPGVELVELKRSSLGIELVKVQCLGVTRFDFLRGDLIESVKKFRSQSELGIAIAGYSSYLWNRREELFREFDAWEIAKGPRLIDEILQSALPKLANGGSSSWKSLFERSLIDKSVFEGANQAGVILDAIREQRLSFYQENGGGLNGFYPRIDVGGIGGSRHRVPHLQHLVMPQTLSFAQMAQKSPSISRRHGMATDLHSETTQRS